jgi:hypothetical protein
MCDKVIISFNSDLFDNPHFKGLLLSLRDTVSYKKRGDITNLDTPFATAFIICDLSKPGQSATDIINWFSVYVNRMTFNFVPNYISGSRRIIIA